MFSNQIRNKVNEPHSKQTISIVHNQVLAKSQNNEIAVSSKVVINSNLKAPDSIQTRIVAKQVSNEKTNFQEANSNEAISANRIQNILESAKEISREEGRQLEKKAVPSNDTKISDQNTLSSAIGSAFKRNSATEQKVVQYANGMIEVVTAYGTKNCITPIKDFERGGPVEVESIPMTCP